MIKANSKKAKEKLFKGLCRKLTKHSTKSYSQLTLWMVIQWKKLIFLLPFLFVWTPTLHLLYKHVSPISCIHSPMNAVPFTTESALQYSDLEPSRKTIYTSIMPCYIRFVLCKMYLAKTPQLKSLNMNAGSGRS